MSNYSVFTHEVGFYGIVKIGSAPGIVPDVTILATGGDVNLNTDPIFSTGVWGAGWYSAANQVAYAVNAMRIEGSAAFELAAGDIFNAVKSFGFENRASDYGHLLKVLPQAKSGFYGNAWCSGVSFDASVDSLVTGNLSYSSGTIIPEKSWQGEGWITGTLQPGHKGDVSDPYKNPLPFTSPTSVYPFWATKVAIATDNPPVTFVQLSDIISWTANYTSELNFLTLCNGVTTAPVAPDYIMVGGMDADGSFTIFSIPDQLSPVNFQLMKACRISLAPGITPSIYNTITFPYIVYNSGSTSVQTGGTYIQSDISFTAVGDGTEPPMKIA